MKSAKEKRAKLLKSGSLREFAENIPKGVVSFLLAAPAVIFIISMVVELYNCLFAYNTYSVDIFQVNQAAAITGLIAVVVYLLKLRSSGGHVVSVFKNPAVLCFGALVFCMLLSTRYNGITDEVMFGSLYRSESLSCFIMYPTVYYFVSSLIDSETVKHRVIDCFLAASLLVASVTLLHIIAVDHGFTRLASFTYTLGSVGIVGIYHNANHYGYSLLIASSLSGAMFVSAEKLSFRIFYLLSFILFNAVLVRNNTFGAYLALLVALVFLIVLFIIKDRKPNPRTFILLGVFIAVSLAVNFSMIWANISTFVTDIRNIIISAPDAEYAGSSRWRLWKATFEMISERPLLGYGVEGIGVRLMAEAGNDRPHNEFLQYAAFFGIPALICYISAVASVFLSFLKHRLESSPCTIAVLTAAFGYLASSCFGNTMYYTAPLFFIVLGMADMYSSKPGNTIKKAEKS